VVVMRPSSAGALWLGLVLGAVVMLSTAACASGDRASSDASSPSDSATSVSPDAPSDDAEILTDPKLKTQDLGGTVACGDTEFTDVAPIPQNLSTLDVPFYPCALEVAAVTGTDPLFVGEYVTGHALTIVNMVVRDQFEDSDWELIERSVEGSNTISRVQKPGYSLVVVVGPERTTDADTSIHYTLRTQ